MTERITVGLQYGKALPVGNLGITVTLTRGETDLHMGEDGKTFHTTSGEADLKKGDEVVHVEFGGSHAFDAFGYRMGIFGAGGNFELSVYPEGDPIKP